MTTEDKPLEIVELEKTYSIIIYKKDKQFYAKSERADSELNYYILNSRKTVIELHIVKTELTSLDFLKNFRSLKVLSMTANKIEDISAISDLNNLRYIYLGGNKIKDVSPMCGLKKVEELAIWGNPINNIEELGKMRSLKNLYCQMLRIKKLDFLETLINLEILYFSNNMVKELQPLVKLEKLRRAAGNSNNISNLIPLIHVKKLTGFSVSNNLIKEIPLEVAKKFNYNIVTSVSMAEDADDVGISVKNNPLEFPPLSVIELQDGSVLDYYNTSCSFGHAPLSEGRILFVGDGSAGKSSLIDRLLHDTFELGKCQTNGISINPWMQIHQDGRQLAFHIWDFGGQEIQHAVHKFFFTEGCFYILVLDNRKEEEPEYWLQQIEVLGSSAPVVVVFNKQDNNPIEIADRKFLKEKYPNIIGFFNTSCKSGSGIEDLRKELILQISRLRTVEEQFPNNWFNIKRSIKDLTSGLQHYLTYDTYRQICEENNVITENTQKLLLKYFTTIGAITWFGDTYLNFFHVLSPAWITQGVYKIITGKETAYSLGHINIKNFKELLKPLNSKDYIYEEAHYGYILSMMKKFDLCYTADEENLLLPSAFGKVPKLEYSDFRGEDVRHYILQFKDYMPMAVIHRFIAKKLSDVYDNNYWYSGIVIRDNKTDSLTMVQADKESKRINIRIKGSSKLGVWEHIRREFDSISSNYAGINYSEILSLDGSAENIVNYDDLVSHIKANKSVYFHAKQQRDYNVGYLVGFFETKEETIDKFRTENGDSYSKGSKRANDGLNLVVNILNNNSPTVSANFDNHISFNTNIIQNYASEVKGEANYLLEAIESLSISNKALSDSLTKLINFSDEAKKATNGNDLKEKGWGRKLKNIVEVLKNSKDYVKSIEDGKESMTTIYESLRKLLPHLGITDLTTLDDLINIFQ